MKNHDVSWKFILVTLGLSYAQEAVMATELTPMDFAQFSPLGVERPEGNSTMGGSMGTFPPQDNIGSPSRDGTVGGGGLYLPVPESGMPPTPHETRRGYCIEKDSIRLFRGILPVAGGEAIADSVSSEISLWFYIPENNAIRAEFSILKEGQNFEVLGAANKQEFLAHYEEFNDISNRQGFVQITLPKHALEPGKKYLWDLTLTCDERDRATDVYLYGALRRHTISQITLDTQATTIQALRNALLQNDSVLTLPNRQALGGSLSDGGQPETLAWVEAELKSHYSDLWQRYNRLGNQMESLITTSPNMSRSALIRFSEERSYIAMELAQLSAFFGLWGDTVNLLATYRSDYPVVWQQLLDTFFPEDKFWLEGSERGDVIEPISNQGEAVDKPKPRVLRMSERP
ncbi:DUF928 domain-containing protein [[Limnothrix rosea] IAM M-220]|uniref:DUF928 domain-containing protein n=1 Tax=[Limnothrix rosea] IAM M-220 TaxID=454133 RepID=UPI0009591F82|nr:DUF928 domain-containing protein [[Limnothrix rosea] IAM M-220]OKH16940.1 hypothetical protein NIES208_11175 [[Limnothrix rosea] IAM M-220]